MSALVAACTGTISAPGSESGTPAPVFGSPTIGDGSAQTPSAIHPGEVTIRRLTSTEYTHTVADLLGVAGPVLEELELVIERPLQGFHNNVDLQSVTPEHLQAYARSASTLVQAVMGSDERRAAVVGCDPGQEASCLRAFVEKFGRRAYRRPLTVAEVDTFVALAATEADAVDGVALVLRAMLQAPSFLYRAEVGTEAVERPGWRKLTGYELATRLSYLFWATTPSDTLLDDAANGSLEAPGGVEAAALALLANERARPALRQFVSQWFDLDALADLSRTASLFPDWSPALAAAMQEQTLRLADELIWNDGRDFRSLLDAPYTFVNAPLAKLYGVAAPSGAEWVRVELGPAAARAGIVTSPAFLALTGRESGAAAIWRGKFVRTQLLCEDLPSPPANIPALERVDHDLSERERLEQHRSDPACSGCHRLLDPIGFGLARYDAIGAYREVDSAGRPIADDGRIEGFANGEFRGGPELAAKLRALPESTQCMMKQLATYLLGRIFKDGDQPLADKMVEGFSSAGDLRGAMLTFVSSDAFRYRLP